MPRIIETTVYTFNELSDKAKEKAVNSLYYINVDYDWWDCVYEDASQVGITIIGFDLDRKRDCQANICNPINTAELIIDNHGNTCDTWKISRMFLDTINPLVLKLVKCDDIYSRNKWRKCLQDTLNKLEEQITDLEDEYCKAIREEYSLILQREYEYQTSTEAITESILSNNYEFTDEGELI